MKERSFFCRSYQADTAPEVSTTKPCLTAAYPETSRQSANTRIFGKGPDVLCVSGIRNW